MMFEKQYGKYTTASLILRCLHKKEMGVLYLENETHRPQTPMRGLCSSGSMFTLILKSWFTPKFVGTSPSIDFNRNPHSSIYDGEFSGTDLKSALQKKWKWHVISWCGIHAKEAAGNYTCISHTEYGYSAGGYTADKTINLQQKSEGKPWLSATDCCKLASDFFTWKICCVNVPLKTNRKNRVIHM